jgi:hypothetical protein
VGAGTTGALARGMKRHAFLAGVALASAACTIDPVARAELVGAASGAAIFQRAGTSAQVSFEVSLEGEDGAYAVTLEDGACDGAATPWASAGTIEVVGGHGVLRGVRADWDVGGGSTDVVGRLLVARREQVVAGCGEIFNSD